MKSYIRYENAFDIDYGTLLQEKFKGRIILRDDVADGVLKKIQDGARKSPALPIKFKKYFDLF